MNAPVNTAESTALTTAAKPVAFDLSPQTFDQALTFSQYLADKPPTSVNLPPARPTFSDSHALTAFGWACTAAAIVGFFVTVYLRA